MDPFRWFRRESHTTAPPISRVRVRAVGKSTLYYETSERAELAALAVALNTGEPTGAYCMCAGTLIFEIEEAQQARTLTLHHGETLRWDGSQGNVPLASPDALMDWLSAHGVGFVREEYEAGRRRSDESARENARWLAVLPASLAPFLDTMRSTGGTEHADWTAAIEHELPDPQRRATVLLELFGSGRGPWNGYPSYESVPEKLLLKLPLAVLLAAIGEATSDRMREGAARLFSSWSFGKERKRDRARIPAVLKQTLLEHVDRTGDDAKRSSARRALG